MEAAKFPWLLSNVIDTETNQPLGGAKVHHTVDWEGRKIGLVGLVEREWLDTVSTLDNDNIDYTDYVDAAAMLAEELKRKGQRNCLLFGEKFRHLSPPKFLPKYLLKSLSFPLALAFEEQIIKTHRRP